MAGRSLTDTLDDPSFKGLKPEVQRAVLKKMGVSDDMSGKVLAKLSPPSPAPAPNPSPSSAPAPADFMSRVSQRVTGNFEPIVKALEGGTTPQEGRQAQESVIGPRDAGALTHFAYAATYGPRLAYNTVRDWFQDPANAAGDVISGYIMGKVSGAPEAKTNVEAVANATNEVTKEIPVPNRKGATAAVPENLRRLTKEQKAKYAADVDKANREHAENMAEYQKKVESIRDRANQEHAQAISDHAEREGRRRAAWAEKMHKASKSEADQIAAQNRKQVLERGSKEYTRLASDNIRETHKVVRGALDERWNKLREELGGNQEKGIEPVTVSDAASIWEGVNKAENEHLLGAPQSLQQFRNLVKELGIKEFVENEDGSLSPIKESSAKPLDWNTARVHYSAIGDRLASGGLPGNVYQALKYVKEKVLGEKLSAAAERNGHGAEYESLKGDWEQYMNDWQDTSAVTGSPLARALRSPDPGYTYMQITSKSGARMLESLSRYKDAGGRPDLLQQARNLGTQAKAVKVPGVKAKPGKFEPGVPPQFREPHLPNAPKIKEVPVPPPDTKLSPMGRATIRVTGHGGGLMAGAAVGHPWLGWSGGGIMSEAMIRTLERRRAAALANQVPLDVVP